VVVGMTMDALWFGEVGANEMALKSGEQGGMEDERRMNAPWRVERS